MKFTLLALSGLATSVSAAGPMFFVDNKCNFALYLQPHQNGVTSKAVKLPANTITAYETYIGNVTTGQSAVTVSRQPDLSKPLQALWSVGSNPSLTYYDLSTIYGDPLMGQGFQLLAGSASFGSSIVCPPRTSGDCPNTYSPGNPNGNNAIFNQGTNANLILQFCTSTGKP